MTKSKHDCHSVCFTKISQWINYLANFNYLQYKQTITNTSFGSSDDFSSFSIIVPHKHTIWGYDCTCRELINQRTKATDVKTMIETNIRVTWHSTQTPTREAAVRRGDGKRELVCVLFLVTSSESQTFLWFSVRGTGEGRGEERDAHFTQNSSIPAPLHSRTYTDPTRETHTHTHQQGSVSAHTLQHTSIPWSLWEIKVMSEKNLFSYSLKNKGYKIRFDAISGSPKNRSVIRS